VSDVRGDGVGSSCLTLDIVTGKVPPAVRKQKRLRILRRKANKGAPLSKDEKVKALAGHSDSHEDAAELTEEVRRRVQSDGKNIVLTVCALSGGGDDR
jgi:hypothetical protein